MAASTREWPTRQGGAVALEEPEGHGALISSMRPSSWAKA